MHISEQSNRLAKLVSYQILAFIALELLVMILIAINVIPGFLPLRASDGTIISINTGFIVMVALIVVLTAASWIAVLVEVAELAEIKKF